MGSPHGSMIDHQSFRLQLIQVSQQGLQIQVKRDMPREKVRFSDQQVGSPACWNEGLRPSGIASIREYFSGARNAPGQRGISTGMLHRVRGDGDFIKRGGLLGH
jgi:hypothetical protein